MTEPLIKARYLKGMVAALTGLPPDQRERVGQLAAPAVAAIVQAGATQWVSMSLDVDLNVAVYEVAGMTGSTMINREALRQAFESPLLKHVTEGAIRLFGLTPASLLRVMPRSFAASTKHAGFLRAESTGPNGCSVIHSDLPDLYAANDVYLFGMVGFSLGVLDFFRLQGDARLERIHAREVRCHVQWSGSTDAR